MSDHSLVYRCRADYWMREWFHTVQALAASADKHPAEVANELAASAWTDETATPDDLIGKYIDQL